MTPGIFWSIVLAVAFVAAFFFWFMPTWSVWSSRKAGQAELAEAEYEQRIQVAKAESRLKAAEMNKKAAIVEAEAVAAQIKEIGEGLQKHDLYLRWQWIKMMEDRVGETIYVPTEANLPVLEAGRFAKRAAQADADEDETA